MATELCKCGHDRARHSRYDICDLTDTCRCFGWWPPGSKAAEVTLEEEGDALHDPVGQGGSQSVGPHVTGPAGATTPTGPPAGPPDLDHAIHAATDAITDFAAENSGTYRDAARIAVEAAWPHIRALKAEAKALRWINAQLRDLTREQDQTIQQLRTFEQAVRAAARDILHVHDDAVTLDEYEVVTGLG